MENKLRNIIILLCYCSLCIGQANKPSLNGTLHREIIRCIDNPEKFREIIYEYYDGNLHRVLNYSNSLLTNYEEIIYNQFGNEEKRIYYNSNDEIIKYTLSTYDFKQRLLARKKMNNNEEIELIFEYDTLSRLVAEKYFKNSYEPDNSCYYFLYEYSGENLVRKSFYMDCSLRSYELYIYDDYNQKVKTEFYSYDLMSKYIEYKYNNDILTNELTYDSSRGTKLISEKEYIINRDKQLIEIIENGNMIKKNYYENKRLIRSENYDNTKLQRPGGYCRNNIVEYEYF